MATYTAETEGETVVPQRSTEELCREASEKLRVYHSQVRSPGIPQGSEYGHGTSELKTRSDNDRRGDARSPMQSHLALPRSADIDPPPYSAVSESTLHVPLARTDPAVVSYCFPPPPPPPPPSPGDALLAGRSPHPTPHPYGPLPRLCSLQNPSTPLPPPPPPLPSSAYPEIKISDSEDVPACHPPPVNPPHLPGYPYSVPNPLFCANLLASPYATIAAPQSVPVVFPLNQMQQQQPHPVAQTAITSNQAPQPNSNNVNVMVQNNVGLEQSASSYICFSVVLLILCLPSPVGLLFAIPAVCCSCIACCTSDYNRAKMMGKCALTCDVIALSAGIATFILLVIPGIVVGALFAIGVLGSAAEAFGLYDGIPS